MRPAGFGVEFCRLDRAKCCEAIWKHFLSILQISLFRHFHFFELFVFIKKVESTVAAQLDKSHCHRLVFTEIQLYIFDGQFENNWRIGCAENGKGFPRPRATIHQGDVVDTIWSVHVFHFRPHEHFKLLFSATIRFEHLRKSLSFSAGFLRIRILVPSIFNCISFSAVEECARIATLINFRLLMVLCWSVWITAFVWYVIRMLWQKT